MVMFVTAQNYTINNPSVVATHEFECDNVCIKLPSMLLLLVWIMLMCSSYRLEAMNQHAGVTFIEQLQKLCIHSITHSRH